MTDARCPLVREIEEAAASCPHGTGTRPTSAQVDAYMMAVDNVWWPRIRAALEAAKLMAARIRNDYEPGHPAWQEMEQYLAATRRP